MKEYKKIYDIKEFTKRIQETINIIKKLDSNYNIIVSKPTEEDNENYIYLHIYYNSKIMVYDKLKYNTIDVISDYLNGIKDCLLNIEDKEL